MFYYVQRCYESIIEEFIPRVPESRMIGENASIPRICLSKTIEGCINATPWGYSQISYRSPYEVFRLYSFDETKIPINNILDTRAIYNCGYVDDVIFTKEVWIMNQNLIPDSISYFKIVQFEDINVDIVPFKHKKNNYSFNESYFSMVRNLDLDFIPTSKLFQGKEFHIDFSVEKYQVQDVLPTEVSFEFVENNKIIFSKSVVFNPRDLNVLYK